MEEEKRDEPFKISNLDEANWAFRKLKENKQAVDQNTELVDNEKQRLDMWLENENKAYEDSINYFEGILIEYYKELRAKDDKAKLSTPHGKVTSRKKQPKYTFDDGETFKYLEREKPELIQTEQKFNKTQVKKLLSVTDDYHVVDENGELVNFVIAEPQEDSITIKTEGGE